MLSFLNPLLLFCVLGASIPVIIHLINRKKAISHKFAAIDFLFQSNKRIYVKLKLRQLLLLILRALLFAFLALAISKPFIKNIGGGVEGTQPSSNVIILDDSYSMRYSHADGSFFTSAKKAAGKIVENLTKDDRATIITASASGTKVVPELAYDKNELLHLIENAQPTFSTTDITSALERSVEALTATEDPIKRIFVLTDLTQNGWDPEWFQNGQQKLQDRISTVNIIDISEGRRLENIAITDIDLKINPIDNAAEAFLKVTVSNYSPTPAENVPVQVFIDQKKVTRGFFNIAPNTTETKEFHFKTEAGSHLGRVEIPGDKLDTDNKRYFVLNKINNFDALLVDGDPKTNIYESETFYLEKALNPGREHISVIKPVICSIREIYKEKFADFDIVFLCNVKSIPYEKVWELESFVKDGGAVVFTLGDKVDIEYYNRSFESLLPHHLYTKKTFSPQSPLTEKQPLSPKISEPVHPVIKVLSEIHMNTLTSTRFFQVFYVEPATLGDTREMLAYSDNTPAVIERQVEKGKVILYTSSIDRDGTDFPVKPFFLPFIQQLCRYISGNITENVQDGILVGQHWKFPYSHEMKHAKITDPAGTTTTLEPAFANNEKVFSYNKTRVPGNYNFKVNGKQKQLLFYFSVNPNTTESDLEKIGEKELTALIGDTRLTIRDSHLDKPREEIIGGAKKTLWGTLLFLALCIFFAESIIARK